MTLIELQPTVRRPVPATLAEACRIVHTRPDEVVATVFAQDGDLYLVGSLAVGLGDGRADIDVYVVSDDEPVTTGPMLAFTPGGVCVDIRHVCRTEIDRVLRRHPDNYARPTGRAASWLASRWLNALPFDESAPALLTAEQRERAETLLVRSLLADLTALTAFAVLAERCGAERAWYLCRRAGVAAWELAACLVGENYLGERWLPARSSAPAVAAVARMSSAVHSTADLDRVLARLGLSSVDLAERVALRTNPEAERWRLAGRSLLLVGGRQLVSRVEPVPDTVAAALTMDPVAAFTGLAAGALKWTVATGGLVPTLEPAS